MKKKIKVDFEAAAKLYGVTSRTARRHHAMGANLADPSSVAAVILSQKRPNITTLKTIQSLIK